MWHPFGEGRVNCAPPLPGSMMVMAAAVMMMVMVPMPTHLVPVVPMAPAHVMVMVMLDCGGGGPRIGGADRNGGSLSRAGSECQSQGHDHAQTKRLHCVPPADLN